MPGRVLLVEDDPMVRQGATAVLEDSGYTVDAVVSGDDALEAFRTRAPYDALVLDIGLPGASGFDVCREVRRTSGVPIVMLTARAGVADMVVGLELGADDYLTKPFEGAELVARLRAVLRRARDELVDGDGDASRIEVGDVVVDEAAFRAFRAGEELPLTTIELRLLAELARNAGNVLSREVLLELVWGYDYLGDSRLVDMAVKRLRAKLGDPARDPRYISTVRGVGDRMERAPA